MIEKVRKIGTGCCIWTVPMGKGTGNMTHTITDEMLEHISILSQIQFPEKDREQVRGDMEAILSWFDKLDELETGEAESVIHVCVPGMVLREDMIKGTDCTEAVLQGAPQVKDGMFQVPRTIG